MKKRNDLLVIEKFEGYFIIYLFLVCMNDGFKAHLH